MFDQTDFPPVAGAYLDSAATSRTPHVVIDAMHAYYTDYRASVHRGMYVSAQRATSEYEKARTNIALFIGADAGEIIFTGGGTAAAQLLTATLEHNLDLQEGDEILVSELDHHATLVPLREFAKRKKLVLKIIPVEDDFTINPETYKAYINEKTKIVSLIHASNVTGGIVDVATLTEYAHAVGAFVIIDAAQTVGHIDVSFNSLGADALFFSGHKMCGPTGVGVLALKKKWIDIFVPPYGGGGVVYSVTNEKTVFVDGAKKFEAGTPPIAEVIGLGASIDYLRRYKIKNIHMHLQEIIAYIRKGLAQFSFVKIYAAEDNIGVLSFVINGVHPHDVAHILAEADVAVRAGFQCAELVSRKISENGIVRASVYGYTTHADIDTLVHALKKVKDTFRTT